MNPISMLYTQFMIFVCLAIGFILGRRGIISQQGRTDITNLVMNVTLPANIISAFMEQELSRDILHQSVAVLITMTIVQIVSTLIGPLLFPRSRFPEEDRKVFRYSVINTNASFIALPILSTLLGSIGAMLTSVALIPLRILIWSVGTAIFVDEKNTAKKLKEVALNPGMIAVYIGFVLMLLPVSYPPFINQTLKTVGGGTTFLSMMIVGLAISKLDFKRLIHGSVLYYCLLRLIVLPLVLLAVLKLLNMDEYVIAVCVIITAVPAGSLTAIMAARYHSNEVLAGQIVLASTLFSIVTLPLLSLLF